MEAGQSLDSNANNNLQQRSPHGEVSTNNFMQVNYNLNQRNSQGTSYSIRSKNNYSIVSDQESSMDRPGNKPVNPNSISFMDFIN